MSSKKKRNWRILKNLFNAFPFRKSAPAESEAFDHQSEYKRRLESTLVTDKADLKWDDVIGLGEAKSILNDAIILPTLFGSDSGTNKLQPCNAVLLYGVSMVKRFKSLSYLDFCFSLPVLEKPISHERLLPRRTPISSP